MADRPPKTMKRRASKSKEQFKRSYTKTNAQAAANANRMHKHRLSTKRHDLLCIISIHHDQEGRSFNLEIVRTFDQAASRHGRVLLKASHSSNDSLSRHTELDHAYSRMRNKLFNQMKKPEIKSYGPTDTKLNYSCGSNYDPISPNIQILEMETRSAADCIKPRKPNVILLASRSSWKKLRSKTNVQLRGHCRRKSPRSRQMGYL